MTARHDPSVTLPWMRRGTAHFLAAVEEIDDDGLGGPSALPGWTRAHVVGHVARNAEALVRLASWARTGVESPMYASREQRDAEIDASAAMPRPELRSLLVGTAAELDTALGELDATSWTATVRSALGRVIPAAEIPWMRIREVWLHSIDLGADLTVADFPPGVIDLLLDDTVAALSTRDGCPLLTLAPGDRTRTWSLGGDPPDAAEVTDAPAHVLAAWLTGRLADADRPPTLPDVPSWI